MVSHVAVSRCGRCKADFPFDYRVSPTPVKRLTIEFASGIVQYFELCDNCTEAFKMTFSDFRQGNK